MKNNIKEKVYSMKKFFELVEKGTRIERIANGFGFTEGPIWNKDKEFLLFSDIPGDTRIKWSEKNKIEEVMKPSNKCNGMTYDKDGNLLVCEHTTSRLVKEHHDGNIEIIASHYKGKELNSPNDVIVAKDGSIYFTDPTYGRMALDGLERETELKFQGVYRVHPKNKNLELLASDFEQPNGLCLSPDEKTLYVNDTDRYHVRAFNIKSDGSIAKGSIFFDKIGSKDSKKGVPDGMKCDEFGNIYTTGPKGIWIISPQREYIGLIEVPEITANLNWGGKNWDILYITASTSIYCLKMKIRGNKSSYMS